MSEADAVQGLYSRDKKMSKDVYNYLENLGNKLKYKMYVILKLKTWIFII